MNDIQTIIKHVAESNPDRSASNIDRRILKIGEELGEIAEAYLNVTSTTNHKAKTWADVREEAADVLIVAIDVALTTRENLSFTPESLTAQVGQINIPDNDVYGYCFRLHQQIGMVGLADGLMPRIYLVAEAFMLADLVFKEGRLFDQTFQPANLLAEVDRKLAKWARNRNEKIVVTDCE